MFGFVDSSRVSGLDVPINWSHRFSQFFSLRLRYQFTRLDQRRDAVLRQPRRTSSGDAGIAGNNQDPVNWGPPALIFSSGVAGLASAQYAVEPATARTRRTAESLWSRGRHNITFGGDVRASALDVLSQQDARGTFAFTGAATGSDLADFLLGLPHTSAIAFGNRRQVFRAISLRRVRHRRLAGQPDRRQRTSALRWEYESPFTERLGRLVEPRRRARLHVARRAPGRSATISCSMRRTGAAFSRASASRWRPVPGSSLVIRAGYGIYRNTVGLSADRDAAGAAAAAVEDASAWRTAPRIR